MYITEISESDFKKLNLKGYSYENNTINDSLNCYSFVEHDINKELEDNILYLKTDFPKAVQTIAVFVTDLPTEQKIKEHMKDEDLVLRVNKNPHAYDLKTLARNKLLYEYANLEKYYWSTLSTYNIWIAVKHIYLQRNKFLINADSEVGELRRDKIKHIYLIHIGE